MIYAILSLMLTAACVAVFYGLRPLIRTGRYSQTEAGPSENPVTVSVIVYADSVDDSLPEYLERLMAQDYPAMKVIVVCNCSAEVSASLTDTYSARYPNLYFTFIPPGSHNLSRHKLAYTVGVKASDADVVLTTSSRAVIPSVGWVSEMMVPFSASEKTGLVLGLASPDFAQIHSVSRWFRQFDFVMTSAFWIGYALGGESYRGNGLNMAFRRELFFRNNGYAASNYIHGGDDDLFVSDIATAENTAVVLDPSSRLVMDWGISASRYLTALKDRYRFTSRYMRRSPVVRKNLCAALQWLVLLLAAASVALGLMLPATIDSLILGVAAPVVILLAMFGADIYVYRRAASQLGAVRLWWSVPLFMLWRPIDDIFFYLRHRRHRYRNFTWQRRRKE